VRGKEREGGGVREGEGGGEEVREEGERVHVGGGREGGEKEGHEKRWKQWIGSTTRDRSRQVRGGTVGCFNGVCTVTGGQD
jgi:hypothetical protein